MAALANFTSKSLLVSIWHRSADVYMYVAVALAAFMTEVEPRHKVRELL